jgi:hypothetical protein
VTLLTILNNPLFPFTDFREQETSFQMLERYWAAVAHEALGEEVFAACVALQLADRDLEGWGNPLMLDVWIPALRRGAKVMLLENVEGLPAFRDSAKKRTNKRACFRSIFVYLNRRGVTGPDDKIDQICFLADMSDVARSAVQFLLRAFLIENMEINDVDPWFDKFAERVGETSRRHRPRSIKAVKDQS